MAAPVTLKVSNRNAKKSIRKLPTSLEITEKTTVQDVKVQLAKQAGGMDPERLGIYDAQKKKLLKDRKALVSGSEDVMAGKEILVKDLGPQLSWTTVFIIEYFGPILIHAVVPLLLQSYLYSSAPPMSSSQYLTMAMVILHFVKREYETVFVHKFSLSTMPLFNLFKNCTHYWLLAGVNMAYWIYAPSSYAALASKNIDYINVLGLALYIFGEVSNFITHQTLSNLRSTGGTERGIPTGYGFDLVTCPNYMFELIAWAGIALVSKSAATLVFYGAAWWQMQQWAVGKEKALRNEFPDKYKRKKYVLWPSLGAIKKYVTEGAK